MRSPQDRISVQAIERGFGVQPAVLGIKELDTRVVGTRLTVSIQGNEGFRRLIRPQIAGPHQAARNAC